MEQAKKMRQETFATAAGVQAENGPNMSDMTTTNTPMQTFALMSCSGDIDQNGTLVAPCLAATAESLSSRGC